MTVIWRDTFIIEPLSEAFFEEARRCLKPLPCIIADSNTSYEEQPTMLRLAEQVWGNIAPNYTADLMRFGLAPFQLADLSPTLRRKRIRPGKLTTQQVKNAVRYAPQWVKVHPLLILHRAGAGMVQYMTTFDSGAGLTPEEAIEVVRLGIKPQLIALNAEWEKALPTAPVPWDGLPAPVPMEDETIVVTGLRDLSQWVLVKAFNRGEKPQRPTGSSTVILSEVNPPPGEDFDAYVHSHGAELRGIGSMDRYYTERAGWLIEREMLTNLSTDSELAVYLLGKSDLFLYNERIKKVRRSLARRSYIGDEVTALLYMSLHYSVLIDWVTLQKALVTAYLHRIDALTRQTSPERGQLVDVLQGAISDLEQYQDSLSPYANRVEFVEELAEHYGVNRLMERFERKQELMLAYAQEYHDYQEVRAATFLNWLAGILAAAELSSILIPLLGITQDDEPFIYAGLALGSILCVFVILAILRRERRT
jgi:hypothetical protein